MRSRVVWLGAAVAGALIAGYTARLLFEESSYPRPGTYAFYIQIPSSLRNMPKPGLAGEPAYFSTAGDGNKPPHSEVRFLSSAPEDELLRKLKDYFRASGFQESTADPGKSATLVRHETRVQIQIDPKSGNQVEVKVTEVE